METRSELRKKCMIILYQIDLYKDNKVKYNLEEIMKESKGYNEFVKEIVYGVETHKEEIDACANKYLKDWTIERLGNTDRAILRIAIFEMLYTNTPDIVAINEALELAKNYSDEPVKKMINGVLDNIYHSKEDK